MDVRIIPGSGEQSFIGTDNTKITKFLADANGVVTVKRFLVTTAEDFFKVSGFTNANILTVTDAGTGTVNVNGALVISGDLTVNGTTTTVNSTTVSVDDKNIELGSVAVPTDITADGGGITLKGSTDKTFNWVDATDSWTSSEHIDLAINKVFRIAGTSVLSANTLGSGVVNSSLTSVGTIGTGVWQGTVITGQYGGTGVNNSGKTITLGGNLTTSGAFGLTLTLGATTNVTLPSTGTLATLAGAETLTNKTISGSSNTLSNIANASLTNSSVTIGSTNVALGATVTTFAGLTSVTSTTFVGALTGNASTATSALVQGVPASVGAIDANTVGSSTYINYGSSNYWSNMPMNYGVLQTVSTTNIKYQFAVDIRHGVTTYGDLHYRTWNNSGVWTPWAKIWHNLNDGSGSGLDADLLDGMNSASANTVSTIVARDASGNFSAGTITAALTGNATTATTLQNARTIAISGPITGTATSFNGGANISIPVTNIAIGDVAVTGTLDLARLGTGRVWDHVTYFDNTTNTGWYKLISVTLGTGLYVGINFEIEVVTPGGNYGGSVDAQYFKYFIRLTRSAAVQNDSDVAQVSGPDPGRIRVERVSLGVFEVQMANASTYARTSYRVRQFTQNSIGTGGSITFHGGTSALATGTGTMITATNTHDYWFSNLRVPGQLFSSIATGTAPFVVASTTLVTNLNADLLDGMNTATANTVSTVVNRDASGNFAAGVITANLYTTDGLLRLNSSITAKDAAQQSLIRMKSSEIENFISSQNVLSIFNNVYRNPANVNELLYNETKKGQRLTLYDGAFSFSNTPSGTAGTVATMTTRFSVNESGQITTGIWQATTVAVGYGGTGVTSLSNVLGTTNQITVGNGTARVIGGDITLSLPQDIHNGASPTFAGLTVDNLFLDGNTISSTNTNGNITLSRNGSGTVIIPTNGQTMAGTTAANAWLFVGDGATGIGFDNNEIVGFGNEINITTNGAHSIAFSTTQTLRWAITSAGVLEATGAQTIRTTTGNLTLATAAANGNVAVTPHGTGALIVGSSTTPLSLSLIETYKAAGLDDLQIKVRTLDSSVNNYLGLGAANILYYRNVATGVNLKLQTSVVAADSGGGNIVFAPALLGADHTPTERMRIWRSGNVSIGNTDNTHTLKITGTAKITGAVEIDSNLLLNSSKAILNQQELISQSVVDTYTAAQVSSASYKAVYFDYVLYSGTNQRAGTIICSWNGSTLEWTDYTTLTQGTIADTSVLLAADENAGNIRLRMQVLSGTWSIKVFARGI